MRIYVFSDSHGSMTEMLEIVQQDAPDVIIHLGDGTKDAEELGYIFPDIPLYRVPGNCDGFTSMAPIQELIIGETRILFAHGHHWEVKRRMDFALEAAREQNSHILLHGHTHIPKIEEEADGLIVMNPGPSPDSYGIITLSEEGEIHCQLKPSRVR